MPFSKAAESSAAARRFARMIEETPDSFRVDPRVYDDPAIFEGEMDSIFARNWVYVGHESEVPDAGSYITAAIGLQPVIVARGQDMRVRVFLNVCRHRGNTLCREAAGKTDAFVCRYHAWTFTTEGELHAVPGPASYSEKFHKEKSRLGLLQARVSIYRGLVFANLQGDGESLEQYLGETKPFIDLWADLSPVGTARVGKPHAYSYRGNWKFQVENGVDFYHPPFVHRSGFAAFRNSGLARYQSEQKRRAKNEEEAVTYGFDRGHAILQRPGLYSVYSAKQYEQYCDTLAERFGRDRARDIAAIRHIHIFPNVCLMDANIRVIQPVSVDATNVLSFFTALDGVPDDVNIARLDDVQRRLGTVGLVGTDDLDIFSGNQSGIRAKGFDQVILDRGITSEIIHPNGMRQGGPTDETPQRAIYRGWLGAMAGSPARASHVAS